MRISRRPLPPGSIVERRFATLTERQIRRGTHRSTVELEKAIRNYLDTNGRNPKPFVWTKTADQIFFPTKRGESAINRVAYQKIAMGIISREDK
jgi:hypothetical protein